MGNPYQTSTWRRLYFNLDINIAINELVAQYDFSRPAYLLPRNLLVRSWPISLQTGPVHLSQTSIKMHIRLKYNI